MAAARDAAEGAAHAAAGRAARLKPVAESMAQLIEDALASDSEDEPEADSAHESDAEELPPEPTFVEETFMTAFERDTQRALRESVQLEVRRREVQPPLTESEWTVLAAKKGQPGSRANEAAFQEAKDAASEWIERHRSVGAEAATEAAAAGAATVGATRAFQRRGQVIAEVEAAAAADPAPPLSIVECREVAAAAGVEGGLDYEIAFQEAMEAANDWRAREAVRQRDAARLVFEANRREGQGGAAGGKAASSR